jgi:hypothetical protein
MQCRLSQEASSIRFTRFLPLFCDKIFRCTGADGAQTRCVDGQGVDHHISVSLRARQLKGSNAPNDLGRWPWHHMLMRCVVLEIPVRHLHRCKYPPTCRRRVWQSLDWVSKGRNGSQRLNQLPSCSLMSSFKFNRHIHFLSRCQHKHFKSMNLNVF